MNNAVICGYARSPFTLANKGELAKTRPDDLLAQVIKGLLGRVTLNTADIEDLLTGCAFPEGEQGLNIARMVVFIAGLPITVGGAVVNRWCGSSMNAIHMAAGAIATGSGELFLATGIESMSRIPMGGFNPSPNPDLYMSNPNAYISMGLTAENLCKKFPIPRKAQEEFTLNSHKKAAAADLSQEIIPIKIKTGMVEKDGCIRPDTTLEKMATLAPAFDANGMVTAATSSPVTDGASAVIVASEAYADKNKLPKLARIKSMAVCGLAPEIMGLGPVEASRKALKRAGLELKDMDIIELNEAFAVQAMAVIKELGIDESKLNIEGGALALGHPLGASGARITGKAAQLLHKHGKKYALATMCIGGGQGIATVLEKNLMPFDPELFQGWRKGFSLPTAPGEDGISIDRAYVLRWCSKVEANAFLESIHNMHFKVNGLVFAHGGIPGRPSHWNSKFDNNDKMLANYICDKTAEFNDHVLSSYVPPRPRYEGRSFVEAVCIVMDQQELEYFANSQQLSVGYAKSGQYRA